MARPGLVALTVTAIVFVSIEALAEKSHQPGRVSRWPCVLVVESPLREVLEDAWDRSPTFRQQCDELAAAHAVVVLQWGDADSLSRAKTRMERRDGVIVAMVTVPTGSDTVELVAHELHHVLEKVRGLDHKSEARKTGSGVWRSDGGREVYETQAAIDAGRHVAKELAVSSSSRRE
jgi:hypothetical protein